MKLQRKNLPKLGGIHKKETGLLNFSDYKKKRHVFDYWAIIVLLVLFVIVALTPILWLFVSSFKAPNEINAVNYTLFPKNWDFSQFVEVWEKCGLTDVFLNTLVVVIGAVIMQAIVYALQFLGVNPYIQYIIRGLIIILAVSIDVRKYIVKK